MRETSHDDEIIQLQSKVVEHIQLAMRAWFGHYFKLGHGTDRQRLNAAAEELATASMLLFNTAAGVRVLPDSDSPGGPLFEYRRAVESWAHAFYSLASAALLDQQHIAERAFGQLAEGTFIARQIIASESDRVRRDFVTEALISLEDMRPRRRVERRAIQRAKMPWRDAIIAAGSALDLARRRA